MKKITSKCSYSLCRFEKHSKQRTKKSTATKKKQHGRHHVYTHHFEYIFIFKMVESAKERKNETKNPIFYMGN